VPVLAMGELGRQRPGAPPDSAVTLYWGPRRLGPGESREVGFAYGLGSVARDDAGGKLAVIGADRVLLGQELSVQALVSNPTDGQALSLEVPEGLALVQGTATQAVPPVPPGATRPVSTVTWRVRGDRPGTFTLTVSANTGPRQAKTVSVIKPERRDLWER
jgi:hypothetical protein